MKIIIFALIVSLTASTGLAADAPPHQIGWSNLVTAVSFEDPFEALTAEQLMKLSTFARVQRMREQVPDKVSEGMQQEADAAKVWLTEQGVDTAALLAKREEIKQLRMQRASATNPALASTVVKIPGYALPLEYDGKKVTEFLLVPWVGACIHTPPPPPNQIVYISLAEGFEVRSRFEPVWVTGTMAIGSTAKELYLVDGSSSIDIGYSISAGKAERYEQLAAKPIPRRGTAHN